jgi:ADP-heptose:LPS heptosyltransferase
VSFRRVFGNRLLNVAATPRVACAVGRPLYFLAGRRADKEILLKSARAILVVCLDEIGNVVLATPFLRELRRNAPAGWITLVVKPEVSNLVELCPYVNEIVTFDWRVSGRAATLKRHARALVLAATRLWRQRFDLALLPRWDADYYHSTYLTYFSGASRRVGYSEHVLQRKQQINAGFDRMLTDALTDTSAIHEVEQYLDVIRFRGGEAIDDRLELWLDPKDRSLARQLLAQHGIARDDGVIALAPGAGAVKRRWPIERFVELGRVLVREYDARFVVVGGPQDSDLGLHLETELSSSRVFNAAGRTTLRQTAAVLERCCLTVSNDSGPMHLAAAVGSVVVEISCHPRAGDIEHYNSPVRLHPWGAPYAVVQPEHAADGCRDSCESSEPHCILEIQPDQVLEAVRRLVRAGVSAGAVPSAASGSTIR